jgi:hypothetical protein
METANDMYRGHKCAETEIMVMGRKQILGFSPERRVNYTFVSAVNIGAAPSLLFI